ncbi:hypothetical protein CGLO_13399 [Colletotrichum gloeosporioides Cg-14]|uniref:Uncharacterized protein n=1 Tax=Colletotrichum gloeosporioides (strain Cg-14) TaxID=1237896 RepID=T0K3X0_COLGC|nr:hypothetical protein CGLO_13399 [Colletotrichum gloeosporioides Cg-14]
MTVLAKLIRLNKSDPLNILDELIGIFLYFLQRFTLVYLVNLHAELRTKAILIEADHNLFQPLMLLKRCGQLIRFLF